jgi:hypothetical protein
VKERNWGGEAPKEVEAKPQCKASIIQLKQDIDFNGHSHAGSIAHRCDRDEHADYNCVCFCGQPFVKNFKDVRP